jgi:hypothetical protein
LVRGWGQKDTVYPGYRRACTAASRITLLLPCAVVAKLGQQRFRDKPDRTRDGAGYGFFPRASCFPSFGDRLIEISNAPALSAKTNHNDLG